MDEALRLLLIPQKRDDEVERVAHLLPITRRRLAVLGARARIRATVVVHNRVHVDVADLDVARRVRAIHGRHTFVRLAAVVVRHRLRLGEELTAALFQREAPAFAMLFEEGLPFAAALF